VTFFLMLKHHCSTLFISSHFQKHSSPSFPHHFSLPKQIHPALVSPFSLLFLKHHYQQLFIFSLSVAETPLPTTFHHLFPMLKHHCSALFISSHFQKHSSPSFPHHFSLPKQLRPTLVSPFSLLLLKHHYQQLFIFSLSVAETPLPATFHHFSRC
jgi:hypothetical protein